MCHGDPEEEPLSVSAEVRCESGQGQSKEHDGVCSPGVLAEMGDA